MGTKRGTGAGHRRGGTWARAPQGRAPRPRSSSSDIRTQCEMASGGTGFDDFIAALKYSFLHKFVRVPKLTK